MIKYKTVAEVIGAKEKVLKSRRVYSEGEDIIIRILTSIWEDINKEETTWEVEQRIQKNE